MDTRDFLEIASMTTTAGRTVPIQRAAAESFLNRPHPIDYIRVLCPRRSK